MGEEPQGLVSSAQGSHPRGHSCPAPVGHRGRHLGHLTCLPSICSEEQAFSSSQGHCVGPCVLDISEDTQGCVTQHRKAVRGVSPRGWEARHHRGQSAWCCLPSWSTAHLLHNTSAVHLGSGEDVPSLSARPWATLHHWSEVNFEGKCPSWKCCRIAGVPFLFPRGDLGTPGLCGLARLCLGGGVSISIPAVCRSPETLPRHSLREGWEESFSRCQYLATCFSNGIHVSSSVSLTGEEHKWAQRGRYVEANQDRPASQKPFSQRLGSAVCHWGTVWVIP